MKWLGLHAPHKQVHAKQNTTTIPPPPSGMNQNEIEKQ
jgi:hypothetical protein